MSDRAEIILHIGFHETGHSAVQRFVRKNTDKLPQERFLFADALGDAPRFARDYAKTGNPIALGDLIETLQAALPKDGSFILSAEDLSGAVPGTPQVRDYAALLSLLPTYIELLTELYPNAHLRVLMTERQAEDWLFAVYRSLLAQYRIRLTFAEFQAAHFDASQHAEIAGVLADLIHPVSFARLDFDRLNDHPLGIGGGLLEALGFDVDGCVPVPQEEPPAMLWHECLRLNRSTLSNPEVRSAKGALVKA